MLPIKHIIKDMLTNRTRLILTILAVAWGTFSIASMLSVGEGLRFTFSGVVHSAGTEALFVSGGRSSETFRGQSDHVEVNFDQQDLIHLQKALAANALVTGTADWNIPIYKNKNVWQGPAVSAVNELYEQVHPINLLPGGRFINKQDIKAQRQVIVLGNRAVQKLFKPGENPLGQMVILAHKPFLVIGVQRKSLQLFASNRMPDDFNNWIPYSTYQGLTNNRNYLDFIIAPYNLSEVARVQEIVRRVIANPRQLNPNDPGILRFINLEEQKRNLNLFLYGIETLLGIIGGLTLVVAGVGIANVMYISVKRSTREIGIRMAMGATTYDILGYYACEALLTTAIGGALGLVLTQTLLLLINQIPMNSTLLKYFGSPKPILSFNVIMIVITALGVVGLLAGIFPARKAAAINPAEALRYE